jgi:hypothetical protein
MQPDDNLIKPGRPPTPEPPTFSEPITVGHQAVLDKAPVENGDGSISIPVTVNHSPAHATEPIAVAEAPAPAPPAPMLDTAPVPPQTDSHPFQAKIDAHPLFQDRDYNPQPSEPGQGLLPVAAAPLPKRRRGWKLLWLVLALLVLLCSYAAVDVLTDIVLPYELFENTAL